MPFNKHNVKNIILPDVDLNGVSDSFRTIMPIVSEMIRPEIIKYIPLGQLDTFKKYLRLK